MASGSKGPALAPRSVMTMAAGFGLIGGQLDLIAMYVRRNAFGYFYLQPREFVWTVPLAGVVLVSIVGILIVLSKNLRPNRISRRAAIWILASAALWESLSRLPIAGAASMLLAVGLARPLSRFIDARAERLRKRLTILFGLSFAIFLVTFSLWSFHPPTKLPEPPRGAGNVLLIVLDTVRAESLSLYGYSRNTTPNLERWAKKGIRFDWAIASAPWSFSSHASLFTGRRPYQLGVHSRTVLDAPFPTLAEFLGARGFQTAGFVANTTYCGHETRIDRGFQVYEDYVRTPRSLLSTSEPGRLVAKYLLPPGESYSRKWARFQARDADGINQAFLDWHSRRREPNRPYFAFLNYFDAHEPFVVPESRVERFGLRPESAKDREFLDEYWQLDKSAITSRETALVRDAYDDCISHLDHRIGKLLDELDRRGALRNTLVIVTSDHGEEFGEHGVYDHGFSLYSSGIRVPLLILDPRLAEGSVATEPVALRDLPATAVDFLGLVNGSPFLGRSLLNLRLGAISATSSPAFSEASLPVELEPRHGSGSPHKGYTTSLIGYERHYIRNGAGVEQIFDLKVDPAESNDLRNTPAGEGRLNHFRRTLFNALLQEPGPSGREGAYLHVYQRMLGSQLVPLVVPRTLTP